MVATTRCTVVPYEYKWPWPNLWYCRFAPLSLGIAGLAPVEKKVEVIYTASTTGKRPTQLQQ